MNQIHDRSFYGELATRAIALNLGRIAEEEVYSRPKLRTAEFTAAVAAPVLAEEIVDKRAFPRTQWENSHNARNVDKHCVDVARLRIVHGHNGVQVARFLGPVRWVNQVVRVMDAHALDTVALQPVTTLSPSRCQRQRLALAKPNRDAIANREWLAAVLIRNFATHSGRIAESQR